MTIFKDFDAATLKEFSGLFIINEEGVSQPVLTIWADDAKTKLYLEASKKVDPLVNVFRGNIIPDKSSIFVPLYPVPEPKDIKSSLNIYYTVVIRTLYEEHMNQILEQCVLKFSPHLYNELGVYELEIVSKNKTEFLNYRLDLKFTPKQ